MMIFFRCLCPTDQDYYNYYKIRYYEYKTDNKGLLLC